MGAFSSVSMYDVRVDGDKDYYQEKLDAFYEKYPTLWDSSGTALTPTYTLNNTFTLSGTEKRPVVTISSDFEIDKSTGYYELYSSKEKE